MACCTPLTLLLAVVSVTTVSGPILAVDPATSAPQTPAESAVDILTSAPDNTHVYVFDGVNPLGMARVNRLSDRLRNAGFEQTRTTKWFRPVAAVEREIRATHAQDPSARFVLIGYSAGSYKARALANRLVPSGVPVAMVGYVGGDYLRDTTRTQVPGADQVVNVTGNGYLLTGRNLLFNGTYLSRASNVRLPRTAHYALPSDPRTFDALHAAFAAGR